MVETNATCGIQISMDEGRPLSEVPQQQPQLPDEDDAEPPGAKLIWFGEIWKGWRFDALPQNSINWHLHPDRSHCGWYREFWELNDKHNAWKAQKEAREESRLRQVAIVSTREGNDQEETHSNEKTNRDEEEHGKRVEAIVENDVEGGGEPEHTTGSQAGSTSLLECGPCAMTAVLSGITEAGIKALKSAHQDCHEQTIVDGERDEHFSQSFSQLSLVSSHHTGMRKGGVGPSQDDSEYKPSPTPSDDTPNGTQVHLGETHTSRLSPRPMRPSRTVRAGSLEQFLENDYDSDIDGQEYVPPYVTQGDTNSLRKYTLRSNTQSLSKGAKDANEAAIPDHDLDGCHDSGSDVESDAESYPVCSLVGRRFPVASFTEEDDSGVEMVVDESGNNKGKQKSTKLLSKRSHENIHDEEPHEEGSVNRKAKRRLFCKS